MQALAENVLTLIDHGRLTHEFQIVIQFAESHNSLDTGAVVTGPVEKHHFTDGRQMMDIALEEPLGLFFLRRLFKCDNPRATWIQMFRKALDRPALAGGVAPLKQDHHFLAGSFRPILHLQQFDLQFDLMLFVFLSAQLALLGILAGFE